MIINQSLEKLLCERKKKESDFKGRDGITWCAECCERTRRNEKAGNTSASSVRSWV